MTIKKVVTIFTLTLYGLSLGFTTLSHADNSKSNLLLQADSPMPPPIPIKPKGSGRILMAPVPVPV